MLHLPTRTAGTVERFENTQLLVRDAAGLVHRFTLVAGEFSIGGTPCLPVVGRAAPAAQEHISASGSVAVGHRARVAKASRILVEGIHDAELVEKIWGDDLRHEGIRVGCILPGSVDTEFHGDRRPERSWMLAPEDVARAVVDLLRYPERALPSLVELRPSRPPRK